MKPIFQPRVLRMAVLSALMLAPAAYAEVQPIKGQPIVDSVVTVDPLLKKMAATQAELPVLVILKAQPQRARAKRIRLQYEPELESLAAEIRRLYEPYRPKMAMGTDEEERAFDKLRNAQLPPDIRYRVDEINRQREMKTRQMRQEIAKVTEEAIAPSQREVIALIQDLGGKVAERVGVVNAVAAVIPAGALEKLASYPGVTEIAYNQPGKPELDNQVSSLGVSAFWNDGYDGGIWDVGVLDSGVDQNHPAISGHTFYENYATNGSHGTGVACMYGSTDATRKGLAFGLNAIIVDDAGDTATSMAGADWMLRFAGDDPEVINYSWGNGGASGSDWSSMARFVDAVVFDYNTPWAKSAGNEGFGTTTLTIPGDNYNGMTVANVDDQNTVTRSDDSIRSTSSRGPTLWGRKKPDIAAPGHNTRTCTPGGGWGDLGGTSSAAPKVGAATLLLTDAGHWDPKTIKAVLINTADAWEDNNTETAADDSQVSGKEWNKTYGWGYIDLWHANFHRDDYFTGSVNPKGQLGSYKLYKGYAYTGDKATLVWEREVDYNNAATPTAYRSLSDLDLRLYKESDNSSMDSDLTVSDNVHQVAATSSGDAVVKVYAYSSSFDGATTEPFALATEENFTAAIGPVLVPVLNAPFSVRPGSEFDVSTTVRNNGDLDAHGTTVALRLPAGFTLVSGTATQSVGRLADGVSATVSWRVRAPWVSSPWWGWFPSKYRLTTSVSSPSYGEVYSGQSNKAIVVF